MWRELEERYSRQKAKLSVVRKMIELGIRIDEDGRFYVGDVMVSDAALARAAGVDRRVVRGVAEDALKEERLRVILSRIKPVGTSLVELAEPLGYRTMVVEADPHRPGVLAAVASILAEEGIVIRQALADDPDLYPDPKLTLVLEGRLSGEAIERIRAHPLIRALKV